MRKPKIMLVDDYLPSLQMLTDALKKEEFDIRIARSGEEALKRIKSDLPDIIILDIMMPDADGFQVCRQLKAGKLTKEIPIIFMTALTDSVDKIKGFQAGGSDYITKPFDCDESLARIRCHLDIQQLKKDVQQERDRFHIFAEAAFEGILIHEKNLITDANSAMEFITGYSLAELAKMKIYNLFTPDSRNTAKDMIKYKNEKPCELKGLRKDGNTSVLEIRAKNIRYNDRNLQMLALHDISHIKRLEQENMALRASLSNSDRFGEIVGKTVVMKKIYEQITQAAASDETVMVFGETGTGKELAARMIFQLSQNYSRSFVTVNCAAIMDNLFESQFFGYRKGAFTGALSDTAGFLEQAHGGTLFLDEIGELTPIMQAKLLRVLQNGEYTPVGSSVSRIADIRIIAATNKDIGKMVREKKMREDFFHRLDVISLNIPPLRMRKNDIPLLVEYFLSRKKIQNAPFPTISNELLRKMRKYDWPGNVRELFNRLRQYIATGSVELENSRPAVNIEGFFSHEQMPLEKAVNAFENYYITHILNQLSGRKKETAEILGVTRKTLYNKLKKYNKL
ncbi:MAG: response regulator [Desulfobacteraceae bacterium]|nr:response regulator [Desulfobacteraceae bacterium]